VIRIHGTARDITPRKQAEAELRLHASVFENLPMGVYVWRMEDPDDLRSFRVVTANPATSRITGIPAESVIGKTIAEAFPALLHTDIPGHYRQVIRTGQPLDLGQVRYGDERVAERVFAVRAFPLSTNCVGVAFEDMSESERARVSLRRAEETLVRVLQSSSTAVFVLGAETSKVLDVNDHALAVFGYARSEIVDHSLLDLRLWIHPADFRARLQQLQSTGKTVSGHAAFRRQNQESFHSLFWLESMDYQNRPAVVLMLTEAPERRSWKRGL
jgi:PAS domain S-box-containing protein